MKKLTGMVLSVLLALSLCACSGKAAPVEGVGTPEAPQVSAAASPDATQAPEETLQADAFVPVDLASVAVSPESDFVFEVYEDLRTHEQVAHIKGYVGTSAQVSVPSALGGSTSAVIYANVFEGNDTMAYLCLPENVTFKNATFKDCTALQEVSISGSNTTIFREAFKNCTALRRVTLGEGVTMLEPSAFRGCAQLTDVVFPSTLETIAGSCFAGCKSLQTVDLSGTQLGTLGAGAFENCESLKTVRLPEGWDLASRMDAFPGCPLLEQ